MLRTIVNYISEETSVHGLKFLANEKVNKAFRILWSIILLLSVSGLFWYARGLFIKFYIEPEINTRIKLKPMSEIPFPAVTICDPVFSKDNLTHYMQFLYNKRAGIEQNLTTKEKNYLAANIHICAPHMNKYLEALDNRSETDIVKLISETSLTTEDIFISCSFRKTLTESCNHIFNKILTDFGFCHSANMQGYNTIFNENILSKDFDSYKRKNISSTWIHDQPILNDDNETIYWTLDSGYIESSDDLDFIPKRASKQNYFHSYLFVNNTDSENFCPQFGQVFKVIFHLPNEIPTIFHKEYTIEIGHQEIMYLTAKTYTSDESLRKFSPDQRRCYFEGERSLKFFKSYTKSHCDWECVTNYTLAVCGCVKFSMPRTKDTPVCDIDKKKCYYDAMLAWPNNRTDSGNTLSFCKCFPTCNDINYQVVYEDGALFNNYYSIVNWKNVDDGFIGCLRLMFKEHLVEVHEKYASYKIQNFIADFGGLLGLFMGCSLISIVEIIFLLLHIFSKSNKIKDTDVERKIIENKLGRMQMFSPNENYYRQQLNMQLLRQDFNKSIKRLEEKIDDLQIQYNVEILSTILQYKKIPKKN
ncbi:hypothetical protein PVAND_006390 [Polypedilum vanderplanki]|uniref:Uncharacterized protein n=1 Tax=Polypedilum vanderplanki TaxID=319348 RepID=A0A9J6C4S3_POLVA|nr:hypothetical protein PVAND_006390 [Polypedilum vanderplanki]